MKYRIWLKREKKWADENCYLTPNGQVLEVNRGFRWPLTEQEYTLQKELGKSDFEGKDLYEGDIVRSLIGGQVIEIRYGRYDSYCPVDEQTMDNIGFFAVSNGYPVMPVGNTEDYAVKIGNIFECPNLRQKEKNRTR